MTLMLSTEFMASREIETQILNLFRDYNGKVNKILPATEVNFTNSEYVPAGSCDRTTGVLLFSLPRMKEMVNNHKFRDVALLYAVIHELSHMDQYYDGKRYASDKEYVNYVEVANTRRALEFIYENTTIFEDVYNSGDMSFYEDMYNEYQDIKSNGYSFDCITPYIVLDEIVKSISGDEEGYNSYENIYLSILNFKKITGNTNPCIPDDLGITVKGPDALNYRTQFMIMADVRKAIDKYSYECRCARDGSVMHAMLKFKPKDVKKTPVFYSAY